MKSNELELVELYHGTAGILGDLIEKRQNLSPRNGNRYVYMTTDRNVALQYARAWTAWALEDFAKERKKAVKSEGVLVKLKLRRDTIEVDPYNPKDEPNQYRIDGAVWLSEDEYEVERIDFSELEDKDKRIAAYCYWIGIARATD